MLWSAPKHSNLLTRKPFNVLKPRSNDTQKVIDTYCTFMLFSVVYPESHPLCFELRRIPILNYHREPKEPTPRPDNPPSLRPSITYLESALMKPPISVATKELTESLSPLDSALTKKQGVGRVMVNQPGSEPRNLTSTGEAFFLSCFTIPSLRRRMA